jgi:hypothetical protein
MKVDKLAKRIAELRRKIAKAELALRLLRADEQRAEERYGLAVAGSKIEARKA